LSEIAHILYHMQYRFLGPTGIKVSAISFGNWVNSNSKDAQDLTNTCVRQAWDLGINFFDTAEVYGKAQTIQATARLSARSEWPCTPSTFPVIIS
jgi:aryl-alcohol dehydrogenase-like predicted oxidoreductase